MCRALAPMLTPERIARIDRVLAARLASRRHRRRGHLRSAQRGRDDPHDRGARAAGAARDRAGRAVLGRQGRHARRAPLDRSRIAGRAAEAAVAALQARGFRVLATLPDATCSIEDVDVSAPLAILFGNEHDGLSRGARRRLRRRDHRADVRLHRELQPVGHGRARDEPARGAPAGLPRRASAISTRRPPARGCAPAGSRWDPRRGRDPRARARRAALTWAAMTRRVWQTGRGSGENPACMHTWRVSELQKPTVARRSARREPKRHEGGCADPRGAPRRAGPDAS